MELTLKKQNNNINNNIVNNINKENIPFSFSKP